jgi:hypothetical protein
VAVVEVESVELVVPVETLVELVAVDKMLDDDEEELDCVPPFLV